MANFTRRILELARKNIYTLMPHNQKTINIIYEELKISKHISLNVYYNHNTYIVSNNSIRWF